MGGTRLARSLVFNVVFRDGSSCLLCVPWKTDLNACGKLNEGERLDGRPLSTGFVMVITLISFSAELGPSATADV